MIKNIINNLPLKNIVPNNIRPLNYYLVFDAQLGMRAILSEAGEVKICTGHYVERDKVTGEEKYIPAYRTKRF